MNPTPWRAKLMTSLMTVVLVAIGIRAASALIGPALPALVALGGLCLVYGLLFGRRR